MTTNTPYPSRKIQCIRACTHQRPQGKGDQYAVSREDQYAVLDIWHVNILKDIKRGPYSKKPNTPYPTHWIRHNSIRRIHFHWIRRIHFHWIWRIQLSVQYNVFIQSINTAYSLLLNTAYRSSGTESEPKKYLSKVSDDESSDLEEYKSDKEETAKIFKIETDVFYYKTPLCLAFNEFNYLLKVDPDLLTKDIIGFKTYEDYKDDWIYEWNENVPWVYNKPWLDNGIWKEAKPVKHTCKPFNYKTGCSEWPTCSWREDGYCNGGNLPGAYHIRNSLHYQDLKWYEALEVEN
ncbi:hypothetical protein Tco_0980961 [Tanacetum coccineum]